MKNMEKLMDYINSNPQYNMKVMYSTPSIYVDSIHAKNLTWTVNTQDFFPYASGLKKSNNFYVKDLTTIGLVIIQVDQGLKDT